MKKNRLLLFVTLLIFLSSNSFSQTNKVIRHENVIYGIISGMALLMDIYQPENSNHMGIIFIPGSGYGFWENLKSVYNQGALKDSYYNDTIYSSKWMQALVKMGYTLFVINHRYAPLFHYPDIFYDCQRAVRFIRYNGKQYHIDPDHIGAMGHSSGGYLCAMLGLTDTVIIKPENPIDGVSSKVQTVVALAAPYNLADMNTKEDSNMFRDLGIEINLNYMGELPEMKDNEFILTGRYAQASAIAHVTKKSVPFLMFYSDNDPIIPSRSTPAMYKKLKENGVEAVMVLDRKAEHRPAPDMDQVNNWFKKYLRKDE
jgi:acetyl esterase/lipase